MTSGARWRFVATTSFLLSAPLTGLAWAEGGVSILADEGNGRYALAPFEGGVAKLDTRTGAITECHRKDDALTCALVPDERQKLQDEIDRLTRENLELRAKLNNGQSTGGGTANPTPSLPSDEDVDRALSLMERFLRRFKDIMREGEHGTPL